MSKKGIINPFTFIIGAIGAMLGAILFAKNEKVQDLVKTSSSKLISELKLGADTAKSKLDSSSADNNDKVVSFVSKTLSDISKQLEKASIDKVNSKFDNLAGNINNAIAQVDKLKSGDLHPAITSAVASLRGIQTQLQKTDSTAPTK